MLSEAANMDTCEEHPEEQREPEVMLWNSHRMFCFSRTTNMVLLMDLVLGVILIRLQKIPIENKTKFDLQLDGDLV